jgi:N-acetyl-gamma-glutamylphosphate reductase
MNGFRELCELLAIHGSINVTQIHMFKSKGQRVTEYFSYKSKAYNMQFQVVINYQKKFKDVFVGMLGLMNDAHILQISFVHQKATYQQLF